MGARNLVDKYISKKTGVIGQKKSRKKYREKFDWK